MALFNRDYDRDYGYRGTGRGARDYDRDLGGRFHRPFGASRGGWTGYDRDLGYRGTHRGYDQPYWGYDTWRYDAEYKSREQTDFGDPFGDRQQRTPIRVVDEDRDRGWFGGGRDYDREFARRYGRDYYARNPMGYDPYETRGSDLGRLGGRGGRGYRGRVDYDRGWF